MATIFDQLSACIVKRKRFNVASRHFDPRCDATGFAFVEAPSNYRGFARLNSRSRHECHVQFENGNRPAFRHHSDSKSGTGYWNSSIVSRLYVNVGRCELFNLALKQRQQRPAKCSRKTQPARLACCVKDRANDQNKSCSRRQADEHHGITGSFISPHAVLSSIATSRKSTEVAE